MLFDIDVGISYIILVYCRNYSINTLVCSTNTARLLHIDTFLVIYLERLMI